MSATGAVGGTLPACRHFIMPSGSFARAVVAAGVVRGRPCRIATKTRKRAAATYVPDARLLPGPAAARDARDDAALATASAEPSPPMDCQSWNSLQLVLCLFFLRFFPFPRAAARPAPVADASRTMAGGGGGCARAASLCGLAPAPRRILSLKAWSRGEHHDGRRASV